MNAIFSYVWLNIDKFKITNHLYIFIQWEFFVINRSERFDSKEYLAAAYLLLVIVNIK